MLVCLFEGSVWESGGGKQIVQLSHVPSLWAAIQKDLDRLEKLADRKFMKFNKTKCKVLHLRENNLMLVATQLDVSLAEKALRVLLDTKMSMNQQCALG